mgnify:CR=1 FL=1
MKVSVSTYGGYRATVSRPPLVVDSADLSDGDKDELRRLVAAATEAHERSASTPDTPGQARDAMSYTITIEDEGGSRMLEATDPNMPAEFAELRTFLHNHQQQ